MIILVFALPLACWALAARTTRVGWIVAAVLALCMTAEIALAKGWLLPGAKINLLVTVALAAVAVLVAGIVIEGRQPGVPALRSAARGIVGLILSVACSVLSLGAVVLFIFIAWVIGPPVSAPSSAGVLPLPAGLVITENRDAGCSGGSGYFCTRQIQVHSATGRSGDDVARQVLGRLTRAYGWRLTPQGNGSWGGCRVEGWLLDSQNVCVSVQPGRAGAMVTLQSSGSW